MLIHSLKSKIAYATITQLELFYVGSITIPADIMDKVNIIENERVQIVNVNNGERLETYVISGEPGSNLFALNGPAARKAAIGDNIFILAYALVDPAVEVIKPTIVDMTQLSE